VCSGGVSEFGDRRLCGGGVTHSDGSGATFDAAGSQEHGRTAADDAFDERGGGCSFGIELGGLSDQRGPQFLLQIFAFVKGETGLAGELPGMEPDGRSGVAGIENRFVDLRRHASD